MKNSPPLVTNNSMSVISEAQYQAKKAIAL